MKTEALKQALDKYGFDAAFGGARRDEEKSRAKERIFSLPLGAAALGPEEPAARALAAVYNARKNKGESIRVFPLSNWTELDIWQYIHAERMPIVPLYFWRSPAGGRARRAADHGRRRSLAVARPAKRRGDAVGALPHARLLSADRRHRERRRDPARGDQRDAVDHRPPNARAARSTRTRRRRWRRRSRRGISDDAALCRAAVTSGRLSPSARSAAHRRRHREYAPAQGQEPAALHHLRLASMTASRR